MSKYNRSQIFKDAWVIKKTDNISFGDSLRKAWAKAKQNKAAQIEALANILRENGAKVSVWKDSRIYFNGFDKDITAYIIFDEPLSTNYTDLLDCTALKVFANTKNQTTKYCVNKAKQFKHIIMSDFVNFGLADSVCASWQDVLL